MISEPSMCSSQAGGHTYVYIQIENDESGMYSSQRSKLASDLTRVMKNLRNVQLHRGSSNEFFHLEDEEKS